MSFRVVPGSADVDRTRLAGLAAEVEREHAATVRHLRSAVDHAIRAGLLLIEARSLLPRGEWGRWRAESFPGSERTAQLYVQLAKHPNAQRVAGSGLSLNGALAELKRLKRLDEGDQEEPCYIIYPPRPPWPSLAEARRRRRRAQDLRDERVRRLLDRLDGAEELARDAGRAVRLAAEAVAWRDGGTAEDVEAAKDLMAEVAGRAARLGLVDVAEVARRTLQALGEPVVFERSYRGRPDPAGVQRARTSPRA